MSFNSSDDDSQERFALGIIFALIALVVATVVGVVVYKRGIAHKAPAAVSTSIPVVVQTDVASVVVENGVVKFYFATAKAELAPGANEALVDVIAGVKAGQRAVISGYTDATGDADKNAELAKLRAFAVRDALLALGLTEGKLELKKPEAVENAGNNAQARRVEVVLAP